MFRWLCAKLTGGTPIVILSPHHVRMGYSNDDPALPKWLPTIAYTLADGRMVARVYWAEGAGGVVLESGGRINPNSESSYITEWRYG